MVCGVPVDGVDGESFGSGGANGLSHFVFGGIDEHLLKRGAGGDHWENVVGFHAFGVNEDRAILDFKGFFEGATDVGRAFDAEGRNVVGGGEFAEIRVAYHVNARDAVVEE